MIIHDDKHLLFIEPKKLKEEVVVDEITAFIEAAMKKAKPRQDYTRGWHSCACGKAHSDSKTYLVSMGGKSFITTSLSLHYIREHRSQVPEIELEKIKKAMALKVLNVSVIQENSDDSKIQKFRFAKK